MRRPQVVFLRGRLYERLSGGDEALVNYAVALKSIGYSPEVVVVHPFTATGQYARRLKQAHIPLSCLASGPDFLLARLKHGLALRRATDSVLRWHMLLQTVFRRRFQRRRPDILHVMESAGDTSPLIPEASALGIATMYHELRTPNDSAELRRFYLDLSRALPHVSIVAALSPTHARICAAQLPCDEARVRVVPFIVPESPVPSPHSLRAEGIVFGFAGRYEEAKGVFVLLDAAGRLKRRERSFRLRMAGAGSVLGALREHALGLGIGDACEFLEKRAAPEAMAEFFSSIDVFVLPSLSEGTPNVVLEALSHGRPVVASSVGGLPDLVRVDHGRLVPPGDPVALADALEEMIVYPDQRAAMGEAARAFHARRFSPGAVLPLLVEAYRSAAARQRGETVSSEQGLTHPWSVGAADGHDRLRR